MKLKTTTIALAVAGAFAIAPLAFADQNKPLKDPIHENVHVNVSKKVSNTKDYTIKGKVKVDGTVGVYSDAEGLSKTDQSSTNNEVTNGGQRNNASIDGGALSGAVGNMGANVAAGDDNVQSNSAALAAMDKNSVFGHIDGETYTDQLANGNTVSGSPASNSASIGGGAAAGAEGNIGLNATAGTSNLQSNSLAAAVGKASMAEASAITVQTVVGNDPNNRGCYDPNATLGGGALAGAAGNIGVNVSAGNNNAQSNSLALSASVGQLGAAF
jgi:hypothetical protein